MLRLTTFFLITAFTFSFATLTRVTDTPEHVLNLNPMISDDGRTIVFESSADLANTGGSASFRLLRTDPSFVEIGRTRAVCPAMSGDGKIVVFASREDLVGRNADRNSEIYLFNGVKLNQLTETSEENLQPSMSSDGRTVAFASNGEIVVYDTLDGKVTRLSSGVSPKISGDARWVYYKRKNLNADDADLVRIDARTLKSQVLVEGLVELSLVEGRAVSNDGMRVVYSAATGLNQTQVFMWDGRDESIRQLTNLGSRAVDVGLQPTISGDGRRVAFATRRRVVNTSDGGVELYVLDLPTGVVQQITNAPAAATAEVVSSLNFDGSVVAFNFPRILSGAVSDDDLRNNSEIYVASIAPRPVGEATVVNAAAPELANIAPGSIASIRGSALGPSVTVNSQAAQIFYSSPQEVVFLVPSGLIVGPAQFLVTNADGLQSKAEAIISSTAPGVFNNAGEAVILSSDTLTPGPFDPSKGSLRLSIFVTGVARAGNVSVTINGKPVIVETVVPASLAGLDEIHVLVPAELRGAGKSTLVVSTDNVQSNSVSLTLTGATPTPTPTPTPIPTPTPSPSPSPTPSPTPSSDSSPHILISQVFGGGGNAGAPFRNDFIEIFNAGHSPVNLSGWSVQYASATASTWVATPLTSVTLNPGQYYLIQESSGGSNGALLTAPDATGTIAMAAGSGKVVLIKTSTTLTGACPNDASIVDLVGYGSTANCFKGSAPAPTPSNTNAILRATAGCTDTRNNVADFALGPPNPKNSNFLPRICTDQ
jgi:uncharacterized protein (TIGR03437 family)